MNTISLQKLSRIRIIRHLPRLLIYRHEFVSAARLMRNQTVGTTEEHIQLTARALLKYSAHSLDGGYAIGYHLLHGWDRGYIETTGYIVPTMFDLSNILGSEDCRVDALKQGEWLLKQQNEDGSFSDISRTKPAVFDTGQVLLGLNRLACATADARFVVAAQRAADWLSLDWETSQWQEPGTSRRPTYLTRTAGALLRTGLLYGHDRHRLAAEEFLQWASTRLLPSGLYADSELVPGEPFLLHTIVYVLEGFLDAFDATGREEYLQAAMRGAEPLRQLNLSRDVTLFGFYDSALCAVGSEKNITGLSQWAGLCLDLYRITVDESWLECAKLAIYYVKSKQLRGGSEIAGLLPGCVPLWGRYHRASFPNWGAKFFADALIKYRDAAISVDEEHEAFVSRSHIIYSEKVGWAQSVNELSPFEQKALASVEREIVTAIGGLRPTIVDLGCGSGRCLNWLQSRNPHWRLIGVDPLLNGETEGMLAGSAYAIPCDTGSVDVVFCSVALQHVADPKRALEEVSRVLKQGGTFIVFDRNPLSLRGMMKPWHEFRGRWLYSWDSPFRERWYRLADWKKMFSRAGLRIRRGASSTDWTGRGIRRFLPINRFILVAGVKD